MSTGITFYTNFYGVIFLLFCRLFYFFQTFYFLGHNSIFKCWSAYMVQSIFRLDTCVRNAFSILIIISSYQTEPSSIKDLFFEFFYYYSLFSRDGKNNSKITRKIMTLLYKDLFDNWFILSCLALCYLFECISFIFTAVFLKI